MSTGFSLEMSDEARSQMPNIPADETDKAAYQKLIAAAAALAAEQTAFSIQLDRLAETAGVPLPTVERFFPNPEAAASALALHYSERAASEVALDQLATPEDNWQGIVHDIFRRGRVFYRKHPVALKLRLGAVQNAGVRHILLQNGYAFAALIQHEIQKHFIIPGNADLTEDFMNAITITDALWSLSVYQHGEITNDAVEASERAVAGYLEQVLGQRLKSRPAN
ncbi:MAG: TetR/AcrR family transcriptional regulator [Pseudomonadota bacterium]